MRPHIDNTDFGSITIDGERYEHDVVIRLDGEVIKRKKKLSKRVFGTSHIISREEAQYLYEDGIEEIVIGSGHQGMVRLSEEAAEFLERAHCTVELLPTPQAVDAWNHAKGNAAGLFHVTC